MAQYRPSNVPAAKDDLPAFLEQELDSIAVAMASPSMQVVLSVLHAPPKRYAEGSMVLADGVDWNPGSGAGFYGYRNGAWRLLG